MLLSVNIVVLALIGVGAIFLQIFLARRESAWPGLILPLLCLLYTVLLILGISGEGMSGWDIFAAAAGTFLIGNIPTAVYLLIYFLCRRERGRKKELEKMWVQDLE